MTHIDVGRSVQSAVFLSGVYGRGPVVPVAPAALEAAARRRMTARGWAYVAGGAGTERTVAANTAAFGAHRIVPRLMADTTGRSLTTTVLGRELPAPLLLAPVGALELAVRGGPRHAEPPAARAAAHLGVPVILSSQASTPMEETVTHLGGSPRWYQLYWPSDDDVAASLVRRAEAAGAEALVVTLDTPVLGWRPRDLDLAYLPFVRGEGIAQYTSDPAFRRLSAARAARTPAAAAPRQRPTLTAVRSLLTMRRRGATRVDVQTFLDVFSRPALTWTDLAWLRERTRLPILVKGVQHPDDARRALDAGADGVVVSNHGGRQVDNAVAALDTLPGIAAAVRATSPGAPVLFDSGIRTGTDVFVALALGADAVLLGRPWVYGLAVAGETGVRAVVEHVLAELDITMALAGTRSIAEIGPGNLDAPVSSPGHRVRAH